MKEKELLKTVKHIALATVNEDGKPHNTILFFIYNEVFSKLYFSTQSDTLHSKNLLREGRGFALVYDSNEYHGGIYLTLKNSRIVPEHELPDALEIYNEARKRAGRNPVGIEAYSQADERVLIVSEIAKIEVYKYDKDNDGLLTNERREAITSEQLLND